MSSVAHQGQSVNLFYLAYPRRAVLFSSFYKWLLVRIYYFIISLYLSIDFINKIVYNKYMDEFAAIADPTRRKIIELLALQGQLSATQIADHFSISAQAISQHLKVLRDAKILHMEKRAQQRLYRIQPDRMKEIENWAHSIAHLWHERFDAIAALLEEENQVNSKENKQNE